MGLPKTLASSPGLIGYSKFITDIFWPWSAATSMTLVAIGRVFVVPVEVKILCTVNAIGFAPTVSAGNLRVGLYRDNGDTPAGGTLVTESVSTPCPAINVKGEINIAPVRLAPGLYWLAIQGSNAAAAFNRNAGAFYQGGTLIARNFNNAGGYAAFENPQSSAFLAQAYCPGMYLVVSSVP